MADGTPVDEPLRCAQCHAPSSVLNKDGLCRDDAELVDSPYWAPGGRVHAFLYAPTTTYQTEFCRACGKGRDSVLHGGSSTMADVYSTHHATQGDAA